VSYNATTFHDRDHQLQGVFAAARDISERKQFEQALQCSNCELQAAKAIAEKASLAKSDFLSSMSHELRSPLNAISGYAQLLEQDASLSVKPREQVRVVRRSADHLSGLIDGILDISKIEAGRLYLSRDEVRLSEFLDQLVGMFRVQAAAKGIDFVFKRPTVLPVVVYADEKRLRQVLINLLSNAVKYTDDGGQIRIQVRKSKNRAELIISDTGIGIAEEDLPNIFEHLYRTDKSRNRSTGGSGIGLSIAKAIVEAHGGTITAKSVPGTGSEFTVSLPL